MEHKPQDQAHVQMQMMLLLNALVMEEQLVVLRLDVHDKYGISSGLKLIPIFF
ncbi:hypothetical protein [Mongoliibacter sp.]|uniref:hypothetical protein n=1 Tax=Mongoliibacter sp. TaxID=2022438 RepID=UPI0025E56984|nr:hypothetical protein [Mongoliibacter sp.]